MRIHRLLLAASFLLTGSAAARDGDSRRVELPSAPALEAFLDSVVAPGLDRREIPGFVAVFVRDTGVYVARAYGFADLEHEVPFSVDSTVIRIASVSKLFTGTAAMQLVQRHRLDLDTDINRYLRRFQVEYPFDRPITVRHLLTHTAGFDDRYIGKSTRPGFPPPALGDFLAATLPPQILPPGEVCTYSNYSNALAGLVVESIVGEDFALRVRDSILRPLGMTMSDYRLRDDLVPYLAGIYTRTENGYRSWPLDFINDYPGGQMLSTGADMGRFMMAHLRGGESSGRRILDDSTCALMHRQHFTHHAGSAGGMAIAFGRVSIGGVRVLSHDGGYIGTSTRLFLFPELGLGMFLACNIGNGSLIQELTDRFAERYLPPPPRDSASYPLDPIPKHDPDVEPFEGWYRYSRYAHGTMEKSGLLFGFGAEEVRLWDGGNGTLRMYDHLGRERRMVRVEPLRFRSIDDHYQVVFRREGRITHLFTNGTTAFEKISWVYTAEVQRWLLGACQTFLAVAFIGSLAVWLRDRTKRVAPSAVGPPLMQLTAVTLACLLLYPVAFGTMMFLAPQEEILVGFAYGVPTAFYVVQLLPLAGLACALVLGAALVRRRARRRQMTARDGFGFAVLVLVGLELWLLDYWNLFGIQV